MNSFELELDEKSRVGSEFMARVINEIRRAVATEKGSRKITQQAIADKIGTSRAVINRQIQGLENLGARRIAEILWAIDWEPHFEARPIPSRDNQLIRPAANVTTFAEQANRAPQASALDAAQRELPSNTKGSSAAAAAYSELQ